MNCPCNGCDERKVGCHGNCTKSPSYDDWKQWSSARTRINKEIKKDRIEYLRSLVYTTPEQRRKR